jgi:cytochrome c oxidase assembly protein subunit 11
MTAAVQADPRKNARTAMLMALLVAAMVGLAFASVPLYRLFCELTGFDGTPLRASEAPGAVAGQIGVRFDANIHPGLPWKFAPVQRTVRIAPGARTQVAYTAQNLTARAVTGQAVFNVTPAQAAPYFSKIECFCFTEQTLRPGEKVSMPIIFFIDPAILKDENTRTIDEITLSYTFYPVESAQAGR